MYACMICVCGCLHAMEYMQRSKDNFMESVLSLHCYVDSKA